MAALAGKGVEGVHDTYRIDPVFARRDIEANSFSLVAASDMLRNPDNLRIANVFTKDTRGKTGRFVMLFRKR